MSRMKTVAFSGVASRELSKHLRANGMKVVSVNTDGEYPTMQVRTDGTSEKLRELAHQIKGCHVVVQDVNRSN